MSRQPDPSPWPLAGLAWHQLGDDGMANLSHLLIDRSGTLRPPVLVAVSLLVIGGVLALASVGGRVALAGIAIVMLTGITVVSVSRRRWRMLNDAIAAGRSLTMPATRLPLLVSSVVASAGLLLAVLVWMMGSRL